jgi:hypothetical protein
MLIINRLLMMGHSWLFFRVFLASRITWSCGAQRPLERSVRQQYADYYCDPTTILGSLLSAA